MSAVFGPGRPAAARRAGAALFQAQQELSAVHGLDPRYDAALRRLRAAEAERALYAEYGDSLLGCGPRSGAVSERHGREGTDAGRGQEGARLAQDGRASVDP